MQLTFTLADDIALQVQALPNSNEFVNQAIKKALLHKVGNAAEQPSKWALFAQDIENSPELQLGDYAEQLKADLREVRDNFVFPGDEA